MATLRKFTLAAATTAALVASGVSVLPGAAHAASTTAALHLSGTTYGTTLLEAVSPVTIGRGSTLRLHSLHPDDTWDAGNASVVGSDDRVFADDLTKDASDPSLWTGVVGLAAGTYTVNIYSVTDGNPADTVTLKIPLTITADPASSVDLSATATGVLLVDGPGDPAAAPHVLAGGTLTLTAPIGQTLTGATITVGTVAIGDPYADPWEIATPSSADLNASVAADGSSVTLTVPQRVAQTDKYLIHIDVPDSAGQHVLYRTTVVVTGPLPASALTTASLRSVACHASTCVAVGTTTGGYAVAESSANSGGTWKRTTTFGRTFAFADSSTAVSCGSATSCHAIGYRTYGDGWSDYRSIPTILSSTNSGQRWSAQTLPAILRTSEYLLTSLSCADATHCVAVAMANDYGYDSPGLVIRTSNSGRTWSTTRLPTITREPAVSCASSTRCVIVATTQRGAAVAYRSTNSGSTWRALTLPRAFTGKGSQLTQLSCIPRTTVCVAAGHSNTGAAATITTANSGTSWSVRTIATKTGQYLQMGSISCAGTGTCQLAVTHLNSDTGAVVSYSVRRSASRTAAWATDTPSGLSAALGINCAKSTRCLLVGNVTSTDASLGTLAAAVVTTNSGAAWTRSAVK